MKKSLKDIFKNIGHSFLSKKKEVTSKDLENIIESVGSAGEKERITRNLNDTTEIKIKSKNNPKIITLPEGK